MVSVATPDPAAQRRRSWFFLGASLLLLALVLIGFARTFFLRSVFGTVGLDGATQLLPHVVLHGSVLTARGS